MSSDSELENLRSDLAQVDALATLRADLAEADANLKRLDDPGLGPPSAVLFYRRYYQREREKIMLRIDLLELPRKIETCKRNYEMESSPGERLRHKKHCQMIQQSRALGRSKETSLPPYPEEAARRSLTEVRGQFRTAELRLQELTTGDAEWAEQLRTTAPPERLATEDTAPAPLLRSSNAARTPAHGKRDVGQPATPAKTVIRQVKGFSGLKGKKVDMARYMDQASLTPRQYDCYSLVKEYGLSLVDAADRLGLHHSTVSEHVAAAQKRMSQASRNMKRQLRTPPTY